MNIPDAELRFTYVRSSGPGGQNVNKVASKAVCRWNMHDSPSISEAVKHRLAALFPSRVTTAGELLLTSDRFRDQKKNTEDCKEKLRSMIRSASYVPKKRVKTKPTRGSQIRREVAKKHQSAKKQSRKDPERD